MATIINSLSTKVDKSSGLSEILIRFFNGRHLNQRAKSNIFVNATNWDEKKQCIIIPSNRLKEVKLRELSEELHKKNTLLYNLRIYIINAFEEAGAGKTELPDDWLKSVVQKFYETPSEQTAKPAKLSKKSAPAKPAHKPTPQPKKAEPQPVVEPVFESDAEDQDPTPEVSSFFSVFSDFIAKNDISQNRRKIHPQILHHRPNKTPGS